MTKTVLQQQAYAPSHARQFDNFTLSPAASMGQATPIIAAMLHYFDQKTGGTRLPRREDIVPSEITHILSEVAILGLVFDAERVLSDVTVQLMGTKLSEVYGEYTRRNISDLSERDVADRILTTCRYCTELRAPVMSIVEELSAEKPYVTVRCLMVPLSEDGDHISRIFAHVAPQRKSLGSL